jgi:hypothetical protein
MKYESPITYHSKDMAKVKVLKSESKFKVRRNTHMKYECPITYHSKDMVNVKVFADRQTDKRTGHYMPPIFRYGGIKNVSYIQKLKDRVVIQ